MVASLQRYILYLLDVLPDDNGLLRSRILRILNLASLAGIVDYCIASRRLPRLRRLTPLALCTLLAESQLAPPMPSIRNIYYISSRPSSVAAHVPGFNQPVLL